MSDGVMGVIVLGIHISVVGNGQLYAFKFRT